MLLWCIFVFFTWHTIFLYNQNAENKASYWIPVVVALILLALMDLVYNIPFYLLSAYIMFLWFDTLKNHTSNSKRPTSEPAADSANYIKQISFVADNLKIGTNSPHSLPASGVRESKKEKARTKAGYIADIEFSYCDADGKYSHRRVQVKSINHDRIEAYCHKAKAARTFFIERMLGDVIDRKTGEVLPAHQWANTIRMLTGAYAVEQNEFKKHTHQHVSNQHVSEILFTGFSKQRRSELESLAEDREMTVRKSVTKNLNYLCAGKTAGELKTKQADAQGVMIIDENEFLRMVNKYGNDSMQ